MDPLVAAAYTHLAQVLKEAPDAQHRGLIRQLADKLGVVEQTVYRNLPMFGWSSGRKRRADRGTSKLADSETVAKVAAIMAQGRGKRGQQYCPTTVAVEIAQQQGILSPDISYSQVTRLLRDRGLSARDMAAPEAAVRRVTKHPNHAHFFDISVALQWHFIDAETGKRLNQYMDAGARFYEGKRQNLANLKRVIHRFLLVDHYSAAYFVRYYYTPGERAEDVVDFLFRAWSAKGELERCYPLQGLPKWLVLDRGSANTSSLVQTLLKGLGVKCQKHRPRNPKASGAVEKRHDAWQEAFESKLGFESVGDLDELNRLAALECARLNAEEPLQRKMLQGEHTPMGLWSRIEAEQLKLAPSRQTFFSLASGAAREATLDIHLHIQVDSKFYRLAGSDLLRPGGKVRVRPAPWTAVGLRAWDQADTELAVTEVEANDAGFPVAGTTFHVFDDEGEHKGASVRQAPAIRMLREVEEKPLVLEDVFGATDAALANTTWLVPQGQPWTPPAEVEAHHQEPVISQADAFDEVLETLGRRLSREEGRWWREALGEGVTRSRLDELLNIAQGAVLALAECI